MKKNSFVLALGLALSLGASEAVLAQAGSTSTQQESQQRQHDDRRGGPGHGPRGGRGGRGGGPEAMLLRGITLSADQQTRLDALRQRQREQMEASREQMPGSAGDRAGAPRQRPDSATMSRMRAQHAQERTRRIAEIRGILNADQRRQFDANVAELRQREAQRDSVRRSGGGDHGRGDGRVDRGDRGEGRPQ